MFLNSENRLYSGPDIIGLRSRDDHFKGPTLGCDQAPSELFGVDGGWGVYGSERRITGCNNDDFIAS